jgi:plasmid stabilization system protein ParE
VTGVRFTAEARKELLHETSYYEKAAEGAGRQFRLAIEAATARALAFPQSGRPAPKGTRRMRVKGFPFSIVYQQTTDGVLVHAVAPSRRQPDYWVQRVTGER